MNPPVDIGIELGGTKIIVGSSLEGATLHRRLRIPTEMPTDTLGTVRRAVTEAADGHPIAAIGIGSFGPLELRRESPRYGSIVDTPKPHWSGVDVIDSCTHGVDAPVVLDTDVNAALLGERRHGALTASTGAYLTVGTGVGGGVWDGSGIVHGANHPEIGHLPVPRMAGDVFDGICPYHGGCLEGMASGTALAARFGARVESLDGEGRSLATEIVAFYVAAGIVSLCAVVPVERVVIGGGVAKLDAFHREVSVRAEVMAAGYPHVPFAGGGPMIVPPGLGDDAGVVGALELARMVR